MILALMIGAGLYGLVALLFLILSLTELLESGRSTPARLAFTIATSSLWPMTLLILSVVVIASKRERQDPQQVDQATTLRLSHRSN